ncbi:MAG TPA: hypothetical protein PK854_11535 [Oscillospiraceae bacterium]|nr:hypothetical protein [Oscillospiraceae bacterium]
MVTMVTASYYQQFDADFTLEYPSEGYGGWKKAALPVDTDKTALVVMHAWDAGTREEFPGWHRAVEYIPRARQIADGVLKDLLAAARAHGFKIYHVVSDTVADTVADGTYYAGLPGTKRAEDLAGQPAPALPRIPADRTLRERDAFKADYSFPGRRNKADVDRGFGRIGFIPSVRPLGAEPVVKNAGELFAVAAADGVNHLIYTGFAINYCLQYSPAGMADMGRRGFQCSAVRQAVTAVERKESVRFEEHKETALWMTAMMFGFVYDADDIFRMIKSLPADNDLERDYF